MTDQSFKNPPKRRTTRRTASLLERYYADFPTDFEHFAEKTRRSLEGARRVLDLGAGTGKIDALDWRGEGRRIVGLDPDPRVADHPFLDEASRGDGLSLPFRDGAFDAVVSVNVVEHIPNPKAILREAYRVLKPGGLFLFKTPNRRHYVAVLASLTPGAFHEWYNRLRGREPEDTFPTAYRLNRFEEIAAAAEDCGFEAEDLDAFEGIPEYLLLSSVLFYPGLGYERWVNAKDSRKRYRANLEIVLRKPA